MWKGVTPTNLFTLWGWWESNNFVINFGACLLLVGTPAFSDISVYSNGEFLDAMDEFGAAISFSYKETFADFPQGRSHDLAVFLYVLVSGEPFAGGNESIPTTLPERSLRPEFRLLLCSSFQDQVVVVSFWGFATIISKYGG